MMEFKYSNCRVDFFKGYGSNFCYVYANDKPWRVYEMRTTLSGKEAADVAKHFAERAGRI